MKACDAIGCRFRSGVVALTANTILCRVLVSSGSLAPAVVMSAMGH
jgi:hypothetical protein